MNLRSRLLTVLGLGSLLIAACGGAASAPAANAPAVSAAPAAPAAPATLGPVAPLTVAVISLTAGNAVTYVAQGEGFFEKAGVKVNFLDNVGATNLLNLTVSGQADLGQGGMPAPLLVVPDGKKTSILFAYQGNGAGGFMVGGKGITSLSQVKKVGGGAPGSSVFGYCNWYKLSLKATFDCVPMADGPTRKAALASGQVDAILDVYPQLIDMVAQNQVNVLIDTRDAAVRKQYIGADFGETAIWGMTDNLTSKKESVTRFMKAIGESVKFMDTQDEVKVATAIKKNKIFDNLSMDNITAQVKAYRQYNHPNSGYITEAVWKFGLQQYANWGLGAAFSPDKPEFQWAQRVDMSYYDNGIGKPASAR